MQISVIAAMPELLSPLASRIIRSREFGIILNILFVYNFCFNFVVDNFLLDFFFNKKVYVA